MAKHKKNQSELIGKYKSILDTITEGYYEVDLEGNLTFFNKQLLEIYGISEDTALTRNFREYVDPDEVEAIYATYNEVYKSGEPSKLVRYFANKSGVERRHVEVSVSLIIDSTGNKIGFSGMVRDMTEHRLIERALKERNEALEKDLNHAKIIQRNLVSTEMPEVPELTIKYKYLPLDAVGGDYFFLTPLSGGGQGVFLGDVSNHGVTAALFLALLKATTDRIFRNFDLWPKEYLAKLNEELLGNMPMSFLTCIYGVFQFPEEGPDQQVRFTFSNAGHPPLIIFRAATGEMKTINSKGILIGMFENINNEQVEVLLEKGDRLFLYTDGIPEAMNEKKEMLGFEEFSLIIKGTSSHPLDESLDLIIKEVEQFKGKEDYNDDIVLLGFEVN